MNATDENEYEVYESFWGNDIAGCVMRLEEFRDNGKKVKANVNGQWLYSDTVSLDSAYLEITGYNYDDFKKKQEEEREELIRKLDEEKKIAKLKIPDWVARGHDLLPKSKWDYWDEIVPIRAGDLYNGMELDDMLDLQEILMKKDPDSFAKAHDLLEKQNHSGMSYALMLTLLKEFCCQGEDFVEYINDTK